jgi:Protein of unknown function (DUF3105)
MSSRAKQRVAPRVERQRRRRRTWVFRGMGILAVLAVGLFAYRALTKEYPGRAVPTLGNQHIASVDTPHIPYNTRPPTSGPHLPYLAPWGIHDQPIPEELQVHNLEDGGVLVQYDCHDCAELIAKLKAIVARYADKVLLAPYPKMDTRIALTAWGGLTRLMISANRGSYALSKPTAASTTTRDPVVFEKTEDTVNVN